MNMLLNCPFCGQKPVLNPETTWNTRGNKSGGYRCSNGQCCASLLNANPEDWNQRVDSTDKENDAAERLADENIKVIWERDTIRHEADRYKNALEDIRDSSFLISDCNCNDWKYESLQEIAKDALNAGVD